jgi:GNAT superfamily N-acetyltransferase
VVGREVIVREATTRDIPALFVDPEREGQGCGSRLHDAMVPWLFAQGLGRLVRRSASGATDPR